MVVKDSILNSPESHIIVQQVNCQNAMGKGLAKAIYEKYPFVKSQYHTYCKNALKETKGLHKALLGQCLLTQHPHTERKVACLFGQLDYRRYYDNDGIRYTDYDALQRALTGLADMVEPDADFAVPVGLGCGLAGGDWGIVQPIIERALCQFGVVYYQL